MESQKNILLRSSIYGFLNQRGEKNIETAQCQELLLESKFVEECGGEKNDEGSLNMDGSEEIGKVLEKFKRFIQFHAIQSFQIWQDKNIMQYLMFINNVQKKIGYKFSSEQINALRMMSNQGNLHFHQFKQYNIWDNFDKTNQTCFTTISSRIAQKSKIMENYVGQIERKKTEKSLKYFPETSSKNDNKESQRQRKRKQFQKSKFFKSWVQQNPNQDIKVSKIECLSKNLQMNQLQKKWQLVVMAGQMNKWIKGSSTDKQASENNSIKFKVQSKDSQFLIIKIDEKGSEQIIPQVVFYKKYNAMKKKQLKCKELMINEMTPAIVGLSNPYNKGKTIAFNKQSKRQKQLNQTLLHIMRIKNVLQYQYKVLTECAINT